MSKSEDNPKGTIDLLDDPKVARKKIMSAVTDSIGIIQYDPENQPGLANLLTIQSVLSGQSIDSIVDRYQGKGYGELKKEIGQTVFDFLSDLQAKYKDVIESGMLDQVLKEGAQKASYVANKKVQKVYRKVGFNVIE
jgi:tryptophanyl-tRNA synthetase